MKMPSLITKLHKKKTAFNSHHFPLQYRPWKTRSNAKMGPIEIRPAMPEDAVSIAEIHYKAIDKYHVFYAGFLATHPRDIIPKSTESALQNPKNIFLVAVDTTTGQTMGFIRYQIVLEPLEAKQPPPEQPLAQSNQAHLSQSVVSLHAPKDHLKDLWKKFNEREDEMEACYQSAAKGEKHFCNLSPAGKVPMVRTNAN